MEKKDIYFWMNREDLDWLGEKLRIQIHDHRDLTKEGGKT